MTNVERFNQLVALHNGCMDHQYAAAFYIFASDSQLFSISKQAVSPEGIDFQMIKAEVKKGISDSKKLLCEIAHNIFSWNSKCGENPYWNLANLPARDYLVALEAIGIAGDKLELGIQQGKFVISAEPLEKKLAFEDNLDALREKAFAEMAQPVGMEY